MDAAVGDGNRSIAEIPAEWLTACRRPQLPWASASAVGGSTAAGSLLGLRRGRQWYGLIPPSVVLSKLARLRTVQMPGTSNLRRD